MQRTQNQAEPPMKVLEQHWIQGFQRGDLASFDAAYTAYGDAIYRVCHRMVGNPTEAEDLVQETFFAAFRNRKRFEGRSALSTWLYRIALDCCRAQLRRKATPGVLDEDRTAASSEFERRDEQLALEDALSQLPPSFREAIVLVKIEGLKYREAAAVLGVPSGTLQSRVFEGMGKLRSIYGVAPEVPSEV